MLEKNVEKHFCSVNLNNRSVNLEWQVLRNKMGSLSGFQFSQKMWKTIFCSINLNNHSVKHKQENVKITPNSVEQKVQYFFYSFHLTDETWHKGSQEHPKHFSHATSAQIRNKIKKTK